MRIGLELDGIVCDLQKEAEKYFGKPRRSTSCTFEELYPMVPLGEIVWWLNRERTYSNMKTVDGAIDGLSTISIHNNLIFVTSRSERLKAVTEAWLTKRNLGAFDVVHVAEKCHAVDGVIDIFVESGASEAREISEVCETYLFDRPYNRFGAGDAIRVMGWPELCRRINHENT